VGGLRWNAFPRDRKKARSISVHNTCARERITGLGDTKRERERESSEDGTTLFQKMYVVVCNE
jgi:hypothetical protein